MLVTQFSAMCYEDFFLTVNGDSATQENLAWQGLGAPVTGFLYRSANIFAKPEFACI